MRCVARREGVRFSSGKDGGGEKVRNREQGLPQMPDVCSAAEVEEEMVAIHHYPPLICGQVGLRFRLHIGHFWVSTMAVERRMKATIQLDPEVKGLAWLRVMPHPAKPTETAAWRLMPSADSLEGKEIWKLVEVLHTCDPLLRGVPLLFRKVLEAKGCGGVAFQCELLSEAFCEAAGLRVVKTVAPPPEVLEAIPDAAGVEVFVAVFGD